MTGKVRAAPVPQQAGTMRTRVGRPRTRPRAAREKARAKAVTPVSSTSQYLGPAPTVTGIEQRAPAPFSHFSRHTRNAPTQEKGREEHAAAKRCHKAGPGPRAPQKPPEGRRSHRRGARPAARGRGLRPERGHPGPPPPPADRRRRQGGRPHGRRHPAAGQHHRRVRRHRHEPRGHEVLPHQPRGHRRLRGVRHPGPPVRRYGPHPQLRQDRPRHAHRRVPPEHPHRAGLRRPHAGRPRPPRRADRPQLPL